MARAVYVTHPEVAIEPAVPAPDWALSGTGRARAEAFARRGVLPAGAAFFSSTQRKARELAAILAGGAPVDARAAMDEQHRPSGYLGAERFAAAFERLFAEPEAGVEGWEPAADAQARIVAAVAAALAGLPADRLAVFCGHGTIGTLLKCHCAGTAIAAREEQRRMAHPGGGNLFVFDLDPPRLHADWAAMEDFDPAVLRR